MGVAVLGGFRVLEWAWQHGPTNLLNASSF